MPEGVGYGPQNTASIGLNLNVIGNHAYAYSGAKGADTTEFTLLKFSTGSYYLVGKLTVTGGVQFTSGGIPNGVQVGYELAFNSEIIANYKVDSNDENSPTNYTMPILIPPYTEVQVNTVANADNNEDLISATITGRIYGKIK
jgi:hypothetical protein